MFYINERFGNIYTRPHTYCGRRDSKQSLSHTHVCTHKHINTCILMSTATVHSFTHAHEIVAPVQALMSTSPTLLEAEAMTFETSASAVWEDCCFSCRDPQRPGPDESSPKWGCCQAGLLLSSTSRGALEFLQMFFFSFCAAIFLLFSPHKNMTGSLSFRTKTSRAENIKISGMRHSSACRLVTFHSALFPIFWLRGFESGAETEAAGKGATSNFQHHTEAATQN